MIRTVVFVIALSFQLSPATSQCMGQQSPATSECMDEQGRSKSFHTDSSRDLREEEEPFDISDLSSGPRNIAIFTTASMPWMTGTAVNPLLRAAHLARTKERHSVTLCVPWVPLEDQGAIFAHDRFETPQEQEKCMRRWARANLGFWPKFEVKFYDARYWSSIGSIVASGDLTKCIPAGQRDVALLEEPEHLNWFHSGADWKTAFPLVVGVVHTDYLTYRRSDPHIWSLARPSWAYAWQLLNSWVTRSYCHLVIKLSDAVQEFPKSVTCNVHGVRQKFLDVGRAKASATVPRFQKGAYYIGKALWAKGYRQLVDNMKEHRRLTGQTVPLDVYGSGPDLDDIQRVVEKEQLGWRFMGSIDHADPSLWEYKVLVNPSLSDVVCTTSAEALAMGKFVVCAQHPSNVFFSHFDACFTYSNSAEFSLSLQHALAAEPAPMSAEMLRELSWEAATERLYGAARLPEGVRATHGRGERVLSTVHRGVCGVRGLLRGKAKAPGKRNPLIEAPPGRCEDEEERELQEEAAGRMALERREPSPSAVRGKEAGGVKGLGGPVGGLALAASLSLLRVLADAAADNTPQAEPPVTEALTDMLISPVREAVKASLSQSRRTAAVATQVPLQREDAAESRGKMEAMRRRQEAGQPPLNPFAGMAFPWSK